MIWRVIGKSGKSICCILKVSGIGRAPALLPVICGLPAKFFSWLSPLFLICFLNPRNRRFSARADDFIFTQWALGWIKPSWVNPWTPSASTSNMRCSKSSSNDWSAATFPTWWLLKDFTINCTFDRERGNYSCQRKCADHWPFGVDFKSFCHDCSFADAGSRIGAIHARMNAKFVKKNKFLNIEVLLLFLKFSSLNWISFFR